MQHRSSPNALAACFLLIAASILAARKTSTTEEIRFLRPSAPLLMRSGRMIGGGVAGGLRGGTVYKAAGWWPEAASIGSKSRRLDAAAENECFGLSKVFVAARPSSGILVLASDHSLEVLMTIALAAYAAKKGSVRCCIPPK